MCLCGTSMIEKLIIVVVVVDVDFVVVTVGHKVAPRGDRQVRRSLATNLGRKLPNERRNNKLSPAATSNARSPIVVLSSTIRPFFSF